MKNKILLVCCFAMANAFAAAPLASRARVRAGAPVVVAVPKIKPHSSVLRAAASVMGYMILRPLVKSILPVSLTSGAVQLGSMVRLKMLDCLTGAAVGLAVALAEHLLKVYNSDNGAQWDLFMLDEIAAELGIDLAHLPDVEGQGDETALEVANAFADVLDDSTPAEASRPLLGGLTPVVNAVVVPAATLVDTVVANELNYLGAGALQESVDQLNQSVIALEETLTHGLGL